MKHPRFLKHLVRNFVPAALIIAALGVAFYTYEADEDTDALIDHESDHVHAGAATTQEVLIALERDTQYLSRSTLLNEAIATGTPSAANRSTEEIRTFLAEKPLYHKARWIDETGLEQVRIDRNDKGLIIVPPNLAENKAERYYFKETMKLGSGKTYLSPVDLDIDDNHSTIRAATPIFGRNEKPRGIVLISYSFHDLIQRIEQVSATQGSSWMLLNEKGYWLKGEKPEQEFGFMRGQDSSMAKQNPLVWNRLSNAIRGNFFDADGNLWMFETIYPYKAISTARQEDAEKNPLKMVKCISASSLSAKHRSLKFMVMSLVLMTMLTALGISYRLSRSQIEKEDRDIDLNHLLGELNLQKFALDQHAIVAVADMNGMLSYVNDKFCAISGYSREELLRSNHAMVGSGAHDETQSREISETLRAGNVWHGETCNRAKDGKLYWVMNTYVPVKSSATYIAISTDITAHKELEDKLRIASIAFDTHEAIVVTDAQANIVSVNTAFEKLTGYTAAEAIGQNPRILQSGKHDEEYYRSMWSTLRETGTWSGEMWDRRKNGTIYPKWLTITTVRNEQGEVTHYVAIFMDISERKRAEEEIQRLAFYDTLTELPNRRLLMDRLLQSVLANERTGNYVALLFMDMDNFKILNDTQGHDVGDMLLIEVANRLRGCVRESDTVARLGGDEFVVILQGVGNSEILAANQAETVAEKIVAALGEPYFLGNHEHHSSVSIGVALAHGRDVKVDELLKRADTAMYQAKSAGRNAVRFFESSMQHAVESRAVLEKELRHAINKEELQLFYQAQVDETGRIVGAEVLLRWINEERGFVSPGVFIPLAEESGLILPIGSWVLETACAQLRRWQESPATRDLQLAVNVSARQFRQPKFVEQIKSLLDSHAFDPSRLKLELTESAVLVDVDETIDKMNALRRYGVQFSMDDFGTGYSSLSYLKRLPLDQIKIDQSFVRDIVVDKSDAVIVKTIIDMSVNFNLEVIAEGVENAEQLEILRSHGCRMFQGYLFGKPVPRPEFELLLAGQRIN